MLQEEEVMSQKVFEGAVKVLETDRPMIPDYVSDNARECLHFERTDKIPSVSVWLTYRRVELRQHEPFTHKHVDTSKSVDVGVVCAILGNHLDILLEGGLNVFVVRDKNDTARVLGMFRFNGAWHMYLFPHDMEWNIPIRVFERA